MDCFWLKKKKIAPVSEELQARFRESRVDNGGGDVSGAVSRGALEPGRWPSEQQGVAQGNHQNEAGSEGAPNEEQAEEQVSRLDGRELTSREQAYLYLQQIQDKRDKAEITFIQVGDFKFAEAHSIALRFVEVDIDALKSTLQEAEAKERSEQESAFKVTCEEAKTKYAKIKLFLDSMIEDAVVTHQIRQLIIYNALIGKEDPFAELPK